MRKQKIVALVLILAVGAAMSWVWAPDAQQGPAPVMRGEAQQANPPLAAPLATTPASGERSVARRLADLSLEARVTEALMDARALRPYAIEVRTAEGHVELSGDVDERAAYEAAARIAGDGEGARRVTNALTINGAPPATAPADEAASGAEAAQQEAQPAGAAYHVVRSGESLWTIARQRGTSVERIKALNGLRSNSVRPGDRLRVR